MCLVCFVLDLGHSHVLFNTVSNHNKYLSKYYRSLISSDPQLIISACDFLVDVMLFDFPAEIFLQRPIITKVRSLVGVITRWHVKDYSTWIILELSGILSQGLFWVSYSGDPSHILHWCWQALFINCLKRCSQRRVRVRVLRLGWRQWDMSSSCSYCMLCWVTWWPSG